MFRLLATALTLLALPFAANAQWQFNGVPVSTANHYQVDPLIVSDGAGGAIIAWYDFRSGNDYDIYAQRLNAAGVPQWTANGVPICTQTANQITISMVSDDAGGAVIVWHDARNNLVNGLEIYAQRVNGSGTTLWAADGTVVCAAAANQNDPVVVKSGNFFVVTWFDFRAAGVADIYAQSLNTSGAPQWTADGVQLCGAAGNQFHPRIAPDGVGGAVVAWEDRRSGPEDIYARRVDQLGNVQWAANGVLICNAAAEQYAPQIVSDGAAGAIIAWYDWRAGAPDIYMQRIDSSGTPLWTANGNAICTASGTQNDPSLAPDFSGGAVVVWADARNGANSDIYGQRVNALGTAEWAANGVPICTAGANQIVPRVVRDPAGAHLVAWFDQRSGNSDVYAQRLDYATGGSLWTPNGVVLCTEPHVQELPDIAPDGTGGAIVAWRDLREGNYYDVYAEHVNASGPTAVGTTPAATFLRASNYPNPFTGTTTIEFVLPSTSDVELGIYDVAGRRVWVRHLAQADAGRHAVTFAPTSLPNGVYFYRVHAGAETVARKMVIMR